MTGTPGTGKTTACDMLRLHGRSVRDVAGLAEERKAVSGRKRGELTVDVEKLAGCMDDLRKAEPFAIVEGHLSHHLRPDLCIVLRCSPKVLSERLAGRGYSDRKLRDNIEAEAIDLVLMEALDACARTSEINATRKKASRVASDIERIISGDTKDFRPGQVDWSAEVLSWY
ncbi:MAG: AAA family ATPase [Methanobacteriota archaeon]